MKSQIMLIAVASVFLFSGQVLGKAGSKSNEKIDNVLDFEADIIEGERMNPNLFLQLEVDKPNLDTVIYLRNDFNDFHKGDSRRRPKYQETRRRKRRRK